MPHHITQRGNRKQDVFFSDADRERYLDWLATYSAQYGMDTLAYCLMRTHVHIVGLPHDGSSMARTLQTTHMRHSQAVNYAQGWTGHLWQGRFYSSPLDEPHLYLAVRYVEQNPVRAGIVTRAEDYPWSSAACHCGLRSDPVLTGDPFWTGQIEDWSEVLKQVPSDDEDEDLRRRTQAGRPWGSPEFESGVLEQTGRSSVLRPRGRPRK